MAAHVRLHLHMGWLNKWQLQFAGNSIFQVIGIVMLI